MESERLIRKRDLFLSQAKENIKKKIKTGIKDVIQLLKIIRETDDLNTFLSLKQQLCRKILDLLPITYNQNPLCLEFFNPMRPYSCPRCIYSKYHKPCLEHLSSWQNFKHSLRVYLRRLGNYYRRELYNDDLQTEVLICRQHIIKNTIFKLKTIKKRLNDLMQVNNIKDFLRKKQLLMLEIIKAQPLKYSEMPFCIKYSKCNDPISNKCPYAYFHGQCYSERSDYRILVRAQKTLRMMVENLLRRDEDFSEEAIHAYQSN